ncbi:serine-type peptidase-like protein [Podospora appendiculata]|uniref:Serine-type peptidase-like protein n=1 Tax=Podospora appendiculata TaxID=314037 RepID=A0AAE0X257_9PEZI|nr:serine-type peptidase-like protein [Podospora appendiculata]
MRSFIVAIAALASTASAAFHLKTGMEIGPIDHVVEKLAKRAEGFNGWGTFDQLIDHANPSLGTFKQRYWYGTEFWKGPGSPIYLVTPGEQAATGFNRTYTTTQRLPGLFATNTGGAVIVLEHRYWGGSSPYEELTVENLKHLTLNNSLKDLTYFANTFVPPFDPSGGSAPSKAPWIFSGGSYSGALAGWLEHLEPGTFWAYHGTSGVVEAVGDFWQYFVPVQEATPANCSKDLSDTIDYIDTVLLHGSPKQKQKLKDKFLLGDLTDADFASALEYGPWQWQSTQFYSTTTLGYTPYYQFCDYIENVWPNSTNKVPGPEGVGQCKALEGYAKWWKETQLPGNCESAGYAQWNGTYNTGCFQQQNSSNPAFQDTSVDNWANRQWNWMLCNEPFEFWQDGAPKDRPTIVSRLVTADYWRAQCDLFFPPSQGSYGGIPAGERAADVNKWTGGWSVANTTRLLYVNGDRDPWRDATVSSIFRPGGPLASSEAAPVRVVAGGVHCSDLYGPNWGVNPALKKIVDEEIAIMKGWVAEFKPKKAVREVGWEA